MISSKYCLKFFSGTSDSQILQHVRIKSDMSQAPWLALDFVKNVKIAKVEIQTVTMDSFKEVKIMVTDTLPNGTGQCNSDYLKQTIT